MKKNRLFNIFVAAVLVIVVALTIQQSLETSKVVLAGSNAVGSHPLAVCLSPSEQQLSIHSVFVEPMNSWVTYTESGPTGVDGGLLYLLSNSRACSK